MTDEHPGTEVPPDVSALTDLERDRAARGEQRLRSLGLDLLERDAHAPGAGDVVGAVTEQIRREARAGRDVAFATSTTTARTSVTEGALRGALRAAADGVDGVIVARCRVLGELGDPTAAIGASLAISVGWRHPLPDAAAQVREAAGRTITTQTGRPAGAVDVEVIDLHAVREVR